MFERLKSWIYGTPEYTDREYLFPLPYKIQSVYLNYGLKQLKQEGVFQKLPRELQHKWQRAADNWHDVRVTEADLNKIDDDSWKKIASKLNLKWRSK